MEIKVNSKLREVEPHISVREFLDSEGLTGKGGVAVAVNGVVVRKGDWDVRLLNEGDDLLIINAAYGG